MGLDVVGSGYSSIHYDWKSKNNKWSLGSCHASFGDNVDLYFCMHDNESIDHENVINQSNFPLDEIIKKTGASYFTSSIAYILAYAYYKGIKSINLYGIDMESKTEYEYQRPCVAFWLGFLRAKGVKVRHQMTEPLFLYGFETKKKEKFESVIIERIKSYKVMIKNEYDINKKNQLIGACYGLERIIDLL